MLCISELCSGIYICTGFNKSGLRTTALVVHVLFLCIAVIALNASCGYFKMTQKEANDATGSVDCKQKTPEIEFNKIIPFID